jgi:hypothetical protein
MNVCLVVARYNEDISWTHIFPNKVIYNKGDNKTIPEDLQQYVKHLPNVGREAHTYLHYIIENYDNLPDVVLFSQGCFSDHMHMQGFLDLASTTKDSFSQNLMETKEWSQFASVYDFRIMNWKGSITPTTRNENYGQWYERVFEKPFPAEQTKIYIGALFSVGADVIRKYQKEFYERVLRESELTLSSAPEAAHFMERTWSKMFTPF